MLYFTGHTPDASYILKRAIEDYEQSLQHPGDIFDVRKGWLKDGHEAVAVKMYRKAHKNDKDGVRVVEVYTFSSNHALSLIHILN